MIFVGFVLIVTFKGHESDARKLLEPYLPQGEAAADSFGFKEGGAMYALGWFLFLYFR